MKKALILVDFQNDFIDGSLGTPEAQKIVPTVLEKLKTYPKACRFATKDTHFEDYLSTQEGKNLPVLHWDGKYARKHNLVTLKSLKRQHLARLNWPNISRRRHLMQ